MALRTLSFVHHSCMPPCLQRYANDSYANEHHSELLAIAGATVMPPVRSDPLASPPCRHALLHPSCPVLSSLLACLKSECSTAVYQTFNSGELTWLLSGKNRSANGTAIFICLQVPLKIYISIFVLE